MTSHEFVTVDVFTATRFGGNPLAVVLDATGLSTDSMQAIAREFNYSESTFILPPEDPANTARVRIFTPVDEIPFAGHPNVGTGFVVGRQDSLFNRSLGPTLRFEEAAGTVTIEPLREGGSVIGARIVAPEPVRIGPRIEPGLIAECASIAESVISVDRHPPQIVSVGLPIAIAELNRIDDLVSARPNTDAFRRADAAIPPQGLAFSLYLYARLPDNPTEIRARMFAPLDNITEDPATGSAAGALGGLLGMLEAGADCDLRVVVNQGVEMGRPSRIDIDVHKRAGAVDQIGISGQCVEVMRGTITL